LTSTFEKIVDSIPFGLAIHFSFPSYLYYVEKEELAELANAVPKLSSLRVRAIDNIHLTLPNHCQWSKCLVHHRSSWRSRLALIQLLQCLISTCEEDEIRETTVEKEIIIRDIRSADLNTQPVNPALAAVKEIPTQSDQKRSTWSTPMT
jgi:hypothetical protein